MRATDKVVLAILEQYLDIAVNSIHGATIYERKLQNALIRVETSKDAPLFKLPAGGNCYALKDVLGFTIIDMDNEEVIFGTRFPINGPDWLLDTVRV
jgi:hypothetical protein